MAIITRNYQDTAEDLEAIQSALMRWIAQTGEGFYCHPGDIAHRIYNGLRGAFSLSDVVTVWEDEGEIVAFSASYPRASDAYFDACVHPDYRQAIEKDVLVRAGENLVANLKTPIPKMVHGALSTDPQRAEILESIGYTLDAPYLRMTKYDLNQSIPEPTLPEGYRIRSATGDDVDNLIDVHSSAFNSTWTRETYQYVMQSPGYDVEREMVVVAPDGSFAAFCIYWLDTVNGVGLFEPVGTHANHRRRGLATALMYHVMHIMRQNGMQFAHVGHEVSNEGSTKLYASLGFVPFATDVDYVKAIDTKQDAI
ncbi:MAG: GNAT family N-acetyltransferase [Chloroflexota bacterium]